MRGSGLELEAAAMGMVMTIVIGGEDMLLCELGRRSACFVFLLRCFWLLRLLLVSAYWEIDLA